MSFLVSFSVLSQRDVSNILPVEVVSEAIEKGYWNDRLSDSTTPEAIDILDYWNKIVSRQSRENTINAINSIRGTREGADITYAFPELYQLKILLLRFAKSEGHSSAIDIHERWTDTYENMALRLLRNSAVREFERIVDNYERIKNSNLIEFKDLDPALRDQMSQYDRDSHGIRLNSIRNDGQYIVNGVFNRNQRVFAVDLLRPLNETIVTFAHEVVHVADPQILEFRNELESTYDDLLSVLTSWLGDTTNSREMARDMVDHVLYETSSVEAVRQLRRIRNIRIQSVRNRVSIDEVSFEPTDEELSILNQFFNALIGTTVINEYKAYGLSLSFYLDFRTRMSLLPPSRERLNHINTFLRGDEIFATNLANNFNPFSSFRNSRFAAFVGQGSPTDMDYLLREAQLENPGEVEDVELNYDEIQDISRRREYARESLRIMKTLNLLELSFLEQMNIIVSGLNNRFRNIFETLQNNSHVSDILPPYVRRGGRNQNTLTPYQILSARMTTEWIIRFRNRINMISDQVSDMTSMFMNIKAGIIDLHNVTATERELIGIKYSNREEGLRENNQSQELVSINDIPDEIVEFFPTIAMEGARVVQTDQRDLIRNLFKLRVIKSVIWIRESLPIWSAVLRQSTEFIEALWQGRYNRDEITSERARQLQAELESALRGNESTRNKVEIMGWLVRNLADAIEYSEANIGTNDENFRDILSLFFQEHQNVRVTLENFAIYSSINQSNIEEVINTDINNFKRQIRSTIGFDSNRRGSFFRSCRNGSEGLIHNNFYDQNFTLSGESFPLYVICYQGEVYLIRRPNDSGRGMVNLTTMVFENKSNPSQIVITDGYPSDSTYQQYSQDDAWQSSRRASFYLYNGSISVLLTEPVNLEICETSRRGRVRCR